MGQAFKEEKERIAHYRRFVYRKGGLVTEAEDRSEGIDLTGVERIRYRTRYFTDSGIIGTKGFVSRVYQDFKDYFPSRHEKRPRPIRHLLPQTAFRQHFMRKNHRLIFWVRRDTGIPLPDQFSFIGHMVSYECTF